MRVTRLDQDPADSSQLHRAAADGDLEALKRLADGSTLDHRGAIGMTPLMTALIHGQDDAAASLLELGADPNIPSALGSAPLMTACLSSSPRMVGLLIEHGADVNYQQVRRGVEHWTALLCSAHLGRADITDTLLSRGADRNLRDANGRTALDLAMEMEHGEVVTILTQWPSVVTEVAEREHAAPLESRREERTDLTPTDLQELDAFLSGLPDDQRTQGLVAGLVNAGQAFVNTLELIAEKAPDDSPTRQHFATAQLMWARWLMGERLTDRADEAERRLAALDAVISRSSGRASDLMPALGRALLALPRGHPRYDAAFALNLFLSQVQRCLEGRQPGELVLAVLELLEHATVSAATLPSDLAAALVKRASRAIRAVSSDPSVRFDAASTGLSSDEAPGDDVRRRLRRQLHEVAASYFVATALAERDAGHRDAQRAATKWARVHLRKLRRLGPETGFVSFLRGVLGELEDRLPAAAAAFERAAAPEQGPPFLSGDAAGRLHLRLGHAQRAAELIEPVLAPARGAYLAALDAVSVESTGARFTSAASMLALALAKSERWDESMRVLDQCKSLRLRYRRWLRQGAAGPRIAEIETALEDIDRGLEPSLAREPVMPDLGDAGVTSLSLFLEEHRRVQPPSTDWAGASPSTRELAQVLSDNEGVIIIGTSFVGTMLALVVHDDATEPVAACVLPEVTPRWLSELLRDWRRLLMAPEVFRHVNWSDTLAELVPALDAALGEPIRRLAQRRSLSRLTIVPHFDLHSVPFWTLPSLEPFDIVLAPSADQLIAARTRRSVPRRALVVGDPTLDLPLAQAESTSVAHSLAEMGFHTTLLRGPDADERHVVSALSGAGLLHFGGHGRNDALTASRASLLLHPEQIDPGRDPIEAGLSEPRQWRHSPINGRYKDLPGGARLFNINFPETQEYFLERPDRTTLWARYRSGRRVDFAELWRPGDMTAGRYLEDCAIVFLSACEIASGGSIYDTEVDERRGIPGALALAGVPCTVGSLWPVADDLALVFVELFYTEVAKNGTGLDVAAAVRRVAHRVRHLSGPDAAAIIRDSHAGTHDAGSQFILDTLAQQLARQDKPFADPMHWGAFFVTGASDFSWAGVTE